MPHWLERYTPLELERVICEAGVPLPSKVAKDPKTALRLRGDLDCILRKALEKEPSRRYESVVLLANDLQRYVKHEAVSARPETMGYRASKFVRRHRVSVLAGTTAATLLVAGTLTAVYQYRIRTATRGGCGRW